MANEEVASISTLLAESTFGANLTLAFVGGSRASGSFKSASDIDTFVVLNTNDRESEELFARELADLHLSRGLHFDHYGEIFSRTTLEGLLEFTERLTVMFPAIGKSPCYRGNCILSIFRKGQVVLRFLQEPKVHISGDKELLHRLESRSRAYFAAWDVEIPGPDEAVALASGSEQQRLARSWSRTLDDRLPVDTPVGIGLERWFGEGLESRLVNLDAAVDPEEIAGGGLTCPLPGSRSSAYTMQCLAGEHKPA